MRDIVMTEEQELENDKAELENTYLTFYAYGKLFGINISNVEQIISYQPVSQIPEFPPYAIGVINLRGEVIPIIDFSLRFGQEQNEYTERTCIIVTRLRAGLIGFVVDAVDEVIKIDKEDISDPPKVLCSVHDAYLKGIGRKNNKKSLLLDIEKVVMEEDISMISREVTQWKKQN